MAQRRPGGPAGPYPAESSKKSIRAKATKSEVKRLSKDKGPTGKRVRRLVRKDRAEAELATPGLTVSGLERRAKSRKREEREVKALAGLLNPSADKKRKTRRVQSLSTPKQPPKKSSRDEALALAVERDVIDPAKQAGVLPKHKTTGQEIYDKVAEWGPLVLTGGPELSAGAKAIAAAARGVRAGDVELGGVRALKKIIKPKEVSSGTAQKAVRKRAAQRATSKAEDGAVKRGAKTVLRTEARRDRRAIRAVTKTQTRREAAANAPLPLKAAKAGAAQNLPVVRGHEQALTEDWGSAKKTLKTTARAVPGLVTVPVGMAIKGGITTGRAASEVAYEAGIPGARGYSKQEILAPVASIPKEQLDFAKQVAKVLTASDSKEVQKEVEDNLGLMLPIMLGLGTQAAASKVSKGRLTEAVRRIAERSRERYGKGHGRRGGKNPRVFERSGQHKEASKSVAKGRTRLRAELQDRQQPMLEAARGATRSETVRKGVLRTKRGKKADLKIRDADVASFLQRNPMKMDDPVAMLAEVKRIEKRLKPIPRGMEPDPAELHTRDVIKHIIDHPDVLANPAVIQVVREYRKQGKAARETPGISPEHSERARFLSAATTRDIPFPEEMHPRSIRDVARSQPTRGRLSKDALRREARRDRSRARALKKKAATASKKAAIMRRELETREKLNKDRLEQPLAPWQEKELKAVKELERRGLVPRGQAPVGGHLQLVTPSEGKVTAKAPPALHERLRERIDKLDTHAANLREQAAVAEQMAAAKHKASSEVDPTLNTEFAENVKQRLAAEGITELPEYQYAGPGRQHSAPVYGSSGSKLTQFPGKSKKRAGTAEEMGLVEEGLRPMIRESIARPVARRESYKAAREVIEANRFEPGGKKEWSAREADELFAGTDPVLSADQWMKVPRQFYKRIYDVLEGKGKGKGITEEDFKLVAEFKAARDGLGEVKGSHYMIVRKAAMDELVAQLANTLVAPKVAKVNRATSFLILGTSPAWAAMQVVAEYAQAAIAQPRLLNPNFVRKAVKAYKEMDPTKRQDLDSWTGVTTRAIEKAEDLKLDLKAGDMDAAANAYSAMEKTPMGRLIRGIPTAIQRVDQWKGGRIRVLATIAKVDKDLNGATNRFLHGVGGLNREMGKAIAEMKGKSLKEQTEWVAAHPKWAQRYQSYLDDVLGNWSALTKNERVAAQAMIFYPFIRMSLRWTFYAFPKRHPIKAAMLYYLGQQNANEVHKLLNGDPSYFAQWAMVPVDMGGEKKFIDLSRIAPGSNALIEALGGSVEGPKGIAAAKVAQPALAALGTAIYGVTPLSGKQEPNSGLNAFAQLLPTTLSAPGRAVTEALIPSGRKRAEGLPAIPGMPTERQQALDKLSAELRGYGTAERYIRTLALPPLPKDAGKERDSALLGRVLKMLERNSTDARKEVTTDYATRIVNVTEEGKRKQVPGLRKERDERLAQMKLNYEEADRVLNNLFKRYKIPHEHEDELFLEALGEGLYGTEPKSPWERSYGAEDNPWSEAAGKTESNPWSGK